MYDIRSEGVFVTVVIRAPKSDRVCDKIGGPVVSDLCTTGRTPGGDSNVLDQTSSVKSV